MSKTVPARRKRFSLWMLSPLALLLLIAVLLLLAVFYFTATSSGTSVLIGFASRTLPALEIEGAKGALLNELEIEQIVWEKDGLQIAVSDSTLEASVFPTQITIEKLAAKRITVTLPKKKEEKRKPFEIVLPDIHLPLDVDLTDVVVDELHIQQGDALIKLRDVRLSSFIEDDKLTLRNLSGDLYDEHGDIVVSAKGAMGLSSPHPVDLDIAVKGDSKRLGSGVLNLAAKGEVVDYQLSANGDWKYAAYPKYQLELRGAGNLQQLDVETLELKGEGGDARLNGRMTWSPELNWGLELSGDNLNPEFLAAQYPGQLDMLWVTTGTLADKAIINLELKKLTGKLQDYDIDAKMQLLVDDDAITLKRLRAQVGDNLLMAEGEADEAKGVADIHWQLDAPRLSQLHQSISGLLKGKGRLLGKRDGSEFSLNIEALNGKILDYPLDAKGGVRLNEQLITAQDLQIRIGKNKLLLNGTADEKQGIAWQLDAKNLAQLSPEFSGSLLGNGNMKGLIDGSEATLQINKLEGNVKTFPVKAKGLAKWQDEALDLKEVILEVGKNTLNLNGQTNKDLGVKWTINAQKLDQLYTGLKGKVKGRGQLSGALDGSAYKLRIAELNGQLAGRALSAKGDVISEAGKLSINKLDVLAGNNHLQVNGQASEPFDLNWDIKAPKLAQVWPDLEGKLQGKGTLKGNLEQLQVQADLAGKRLRYQDLSIATLDLNADQQGAVYTLDANVQKLKQGDQLINSASVNGKGTLKNHTVNLALQHKDGKLDLKAQGGWKDEQWQGQLQNLALRDTPAGNWRLNKPVVIKASKEQFSTAPFCFANNQQARLCAESQWSAEQGMVVKGNLQKIPLAMAKPWLPDTLTLSGLLNADFDIAQNNKKNNGKPVGKVDLRLPDNSLTIKTAKSKNGKKGKSETLYYTNASANLVLDPKRAKLKASIDLKDRGQLRAKGRVDLAENPQQSKLDIKTTINIPDIHWIQQFSNDVDELKGKMDVDVVIKGTVGKPSVTGAAHLKNASLILPETGADLQAINLTAKANRADQMAITGSLKAGQGTLNAKGQLYLSDLPRWKADLNLQGERLLLMNTHEVQALVSPNLVIKAKPTAVDITGTVKIPETTISLRELPVTAKKRSDDIVIVGRDDKSNKRSGVLGSKRNKGKRAGKELPLAIRPNVVVELGDKVSFTGLGFKSRFTGRLRVLKTRQDIVAQGVLNIVDGVYQAYGQELEIEKGRLIFDGSIDNPGLDVRAIRKIPGDILVGIALKGRAQRPESELFSDPLQTETDTLSYLLTGRSVASASSGDSAMLTSAVAGLGIRGGETMAQKLGGQLGLDDVGISSSTGNYKDSELSLGKQIGSKLYVKYIVGLFDSLQKVAVTYQINERLQAEVLTGEQQEIDLNYKFDTNKGLFGP